MAIIEGWLPPTREHYELVLSWWRFYPIFGSMIWVSSWQAMGKTSVISKLNLPGRVGWALMECPGFITLLYLMKTLPIEHGITDLPWQNKVLAGLFTIHYVYRSFIFPWMAPSMSPIHIVIALNAGVFQLTNALCLGGWLGAYGPTTQAAWDAQLHFGTPQFVAGIALFYLGLAANYYHDDELRDIRRREQLRQERLVRSGKPRGTIEKHYEIPTAGLFKRVLYAHYFSEWIEWTGFWLASGWSSWPAFMFLVNDISVMLPRAVKGRRWYIERFGADQVGKRRAVIPGIW